jgi:hypothetical protein
MRRGGSRAETGEATTSKGFYLAEQMEQDFGEKQSLQLSLLTSSDTYTLSLLLAGCSMLDSHAMACILAELVFFPTLARVGKLSRTQVTRKILAG